MGRNVTMLTRRMANALTAFTLSSWRKLAMPKLSQLYTRTGTKLWSRKAVGLSGDQVSGIRGGRRAAYDIRASTPAAEWGCATTRYWPLAPIIELPHRPSHNGRITTATYPESISASERAIMCVCADHLAGEL